MNDRRLRVLLLLLLGAMSVVLLTACRSRVVEVDLVGVWRGTAQAVLTVYESDVAYSEENPASTIEGQTIELVFTIDSAESGNSIGTWTRRDIASDGSVSGESVQFGLARTCGDGKLPIFETDQSKVLMDAMNVRDQARFVLEIDGDEMQGRGTHVERMADVAPSGTTTMMWWTLTDIHLRREE